MSDLMIPLLEQGHLYEQIYQYIKKEIIEGRLVTGEKLPSSRTLAMQLQIARSTVNLAYDQLLAEGYLESVPCKGYFVAALSEEYYQQLGEVEEKKEIEPEKEYGVSFSPFGIDLDSFPFSIWKKMHKEIMAEAGRNLLTLGHPQGEESLRKTLAQYLLASRGVKAKPEQILIGAGNDFLLLVLRLLLGRQSTIAFESPTYKKAYDMFLAGRMPIRIVEMDEAGMRVDKLQETEANIAYVMPSHQFPTGVVMPIGRRMELLKWASQREDRYIIEDDYDSEFRYKGKPIPALQGIDQADKVIYMGTFSKSIAPSLRISFLVMPQSLLKKYKNAVGSMSTTVSKMDQAILENFMTSGAFERHLNRMRKLYKGKHDLLLELLKDFSPWFQIKGENAGSHILLQATFPVEEGWLKSRAEAAGIKVYCLSEYWVEKEVTYPFPPTIILGYAGLSEDKMKEGIETLKKVWNLRGETHVI